MASEQVAIPTQPAEGAWSDTLKDVMNDKKIALQVAICNIFSTSAMYQKQEAGVPNCEVLTCLTIRCCSCYALDGYGFLPWTCGFGQMFNSAQRRVVLERYGIQGEGVCKSYLIGCVLQPCNECQLQREMALRGDHCGGVCTNPPEEPNAMGAYAETPGMPDDSKAGVIGVTASAVVAGVTAGLAGRKRPWKTNYLQCAGPTDCCDVCCCLPCVVAKMAGKVNALRMVEGVDQAEPGCDIGVLCAQLCCGQCLCFLCGSCDHHYLMRRELIERYNIGQESIFKTFFLGCVCQHCCYPCIVAQTRREMAAHGEFPGGCCMKAAPQL